MKILKNSRKKNKTKTAIIGLNGNVFCQKMFRYYLSSGQLHEPKTKKKTDGKMTTGS